MPFFIFCFVFLNLETSSLRSAVVAPRGKPDIRDIVRCRFAPFWRGFAIQYLSPEYNTNKVHTKDSSCVWENFRLLLAPLGRDAKLRSLDSSSSPTTDEGDTGRGGYDAKCSRFASTRSIQHCVFSRFLASSAGSCVCGGGLNGV